MASAPSCEAGANLEESGGLKGQSQRRALANGFAFFTAATHEARCRRFFNSG
jgi:hypothetical protein